MKRALIILLALVGHAFAQPITKTGPIIANGTITISIGGGATWTASASAPSGSCPSGSFWSKTGSSGSLYFCVATVWVGAGAAGVTTTAPLTGTTSLSLLYGSGLTLSGSNLIVDTSVILPLANISGTNGDLGLFSGTHAIGNYAGSSPSACGAGNAVTDAALAATGSLTLTCTSLFSGTSGTDTRWTSSTALGNSSSTDDGSTKTVAGLADTTCTDNTTGAAGIITVTPTAKCTLLRLTETGTQLSIVGIAHTAGMSRTLEIRNETGQTALVYNLNSNASAADQIGGDFSSAWPIVTGNSFKVTYDTTLTKWTPSLNSDLGATVVNGAFSSTGNNQLLGGQTKIGNLNTAVLSPSAITGTVNNWSPSGWTNATTTRIEVALSGAVTLTGLAAINAGSYVTLCNASTTFALTISDDSGSSSAGNQFFNGNPFAITLNPHSGPDMECATYQEATAASGWSLIATTASTQGSMEYTSGLTVDSSGITCAGCGITGSALSTAGLVTGGGFVGINGYGATHIEQNDEWMLGGFNRITAATTLLSNSWVLDTSGSISGALGVLGKGRPGIWEMDFGLGAAGAYLDTHTGNNSVDFTTGNWTFEWVGGWPTLSSTSSGTATMYAALIGFFDGGGSISPSNGCFFMYDAGNASTLGNNSSKVQNLEATCVTGGSHTTYLLNGSGNCDASFVKGTVAATALTYPNTGIQHLEVVMTGHSEADFYTLNGITATQVCKITTNIPATTSVPVGIQLLFASEAAAGTGARQMDTDYTHWSVDLTSLRSP